MGKWDVWREEWRERQTLHAHAVDRAAEDRLLFTHVDEPAIYRKVPVRNLEMINARDSFNRQAGWSSINLEKLQAQIEADNAEEVQKTLEKYQAYLEEEESKKR